MKVSGFGVPLLAAALVLSAAASAMEPAPNAQRDAAERMTFKSNRILVKYRDKTKTITQDTAPRLAKELGARAGIELKQDKITGANTLVVTLDQPKTPEELKALAGRITRGNPDVEYAEPERIMQVQQVQVNDPLYRDQWDYHLDKTGIDVAKAWEKSTGKGVTVAVIDTGIRPHQDLAGKILPGYNFISDVTRSNNGNGRGPDATDPGDWCPNPDGKTFRPSTWHGTHVSGTIAALTNNGIGVSGVARDAMILPVRALGRCGGTNFDIADAILWAGGIHVDGVPDNQNPAKVINMSLGGVGECGPLYSDVIGRVRALGVTVVVSAGNSDTDAINFNPANCDGVIAVAATNRAGGRAYFGRPQAGSNFGSIVKIAAPGGEVYADQKEGILSTLNTGVTEPGEDTYRYYQGTSMAAPHVTGAVALLQQIRPSITPDDVLMALQTTAQPFPTGGSRPCTPETCGAGIVDAAAAVDYASSPDKARVSSRSPSKPQTSSVAGTASAPAVDKDDAKTLIGQWMIGDTGQILRISPGGDWFHPGHGIAKIRGADDDADIKVFYEQGSAHCSYRVTFSDGGKTLELVASDRTQDPDYCPEGSLKRIEGDSADFSRR